MSIYSAMLAGVTGLTANSSALAAIGDNIANVNTVGYKRNANNFSTLVTRNSSGAYSAGGVRAVTHQYVGQQGLLQSSNSGTDLAISGNGFFVTTQKAEDLTPTDARMFTRAGSFTVDNMGYLKNAAGLYLQGWQADSDGEVITDPSDITRLASINVGSVGGAAEATTRVAIDANLKSGQAVSAAVAPVNTYTAGDLTAYANDNTAAGAVKPDFEIQVPISDSKGGARTLMVSFLKSATPNEWYAEIRVPENADGTYDIVNSGGALPPGLIRSGLVRFTADGRLDQTVFAGQLLDPTDPTLTFAASASGAPAAGAYRWATALGIEAQDVRIDLSQGAGGLTQYDSQSVVQAVTTNGTAFGNLTNVEIGEEGDVVAIFDNGTTRRIAQIAIATFPNPDGLASVNGNAYRVSMESGTYNFKAPGTGGAGFIAPASLESSTVDLSAEFTGLITTQRAYSASSKIITTADQMLEELINIKR
jgi:flagellar hook protein FlgE